VIYICTACGLLYFWEKEPEEWPACGGRNCRTVNKWKELEITATARSYEYSEAGGEITGIDTHVSIEVATCE
jgi:hypothetical protein